MKFELKTENKNYLETFSHALRAISTLVLIIIFCDASLKLRIIQDIIKFIITVDFYRLKNQNLTLRN